MGRIIFLRIMIACGDTLRASLLLSWYFPFFLSYNLWCGNGSKVHMGDLADPDPWGKNCRKFTSKIAENLNYFFLNEQNLLTLSSTISIERWVAIQILEYKNRPASKLRLDPQHYCQYRYIELHCILWWRGGSSTCGDDSLHPWSLTRTAGRSQSWAADPVGWTVSPPTNITMFNGSFLLGTSWYKLDLNSGPSRRKNDELFVLFADPVRTTISNKKKYA